MAHTVREQILMALRKRTWYSGQELAETLNISRTAIWKHMQTLKDEGYHIISNKKQGYQLVDEGDLLTPIAIEQWLTTSRLGQQILHFDELDTTQRIAHEQAQQQAAEGTLVVCDHQTNGRGQLGRTWHEAKNKGIAMSLLVRPDVPMHQAGQLTLVAGIALAKTLRSLDTPVTIKWPNDILIHGRKVAGILTEMQTEADRISSVIIGIGINVHHQQFSEGIENRATSLAKETGQSFRRAEVVGRFLNQFELLYTQWLELGFGSFVADWEDLADRLNETVTLRTRQATASGTLLGIDETGTIRIQTDAGETRFHSAELVYWEKE
ncbi:biotin--[acetyl-CoA-carboxylase] ligase [Exiguobacterium sp. BMC-KP]|uniref:biotin--[acetyl-CoA-carboxylase] ligase n=1 Tax=Exiguobacterium sp. BMC-KP TaxID=1684312 RepID=UPI001F218FA8|nr:biotin--[acetyl-CoA-carboxylase] ligase [Exiguobacterium sp. BMC-KP]